jgi:hypothetical protein
MKTQAMSIRGVVRKAKVALAAGSLAVALLVIPMTHGDEADAMRMSTRAASRACSNAGGSVYYDFMTEDFSVYNFSCTLPSGNSFRCFATYELFGGMMDC